MPQALSLQIHPVEARANSLADAAEQIVASLALAITCCCLQDEKSARAQIIRARNVLQLLPAHNRTCRPERLMKLVRLTIEVGGLLATALLPIVDDVLLTPTITPGRADRWPVALETGHSVVRLSSVEITYFRIRLRTGRLASALILLDERESLQSLQAAARGVISQCLYDEIRPPVPLDVVDDYLTLAGNCARLNNLPLLRLALNKAREILHRQSRSADNIDHQQRVQSLMDQIANIDQAIMAMAT